LKKACREVKESEALFVAILAIATAGLRLTYNGGFGASGALPRGIKILLFSRRRLALKKCESPACRQAPERCTQV